MAEANDCGLPTLLDGPDRELVTGGDAWNAEQRGEGPMQRADRNFAEMLQELRVTQTGVQILFAFLLSLAFTPRFASVTDFERTVYVISLVSSAVTAALLIAPVPAHRIQFRRGRKLELVRLVHGCLMAGLTTLLITVSGALLLVLDVVAGTRVAVTITAAMGCFVVALWVVLPVHLHRQVRR
jgi:MFS family permease